MWRLKRNQCKWSEEIITEAEEIIPAMTNKVLQEIRSLEKGKCTGEDRITIYLIEEEEEFSKMLANKMSREVRCTTRRR